ncbi:four helix bundle protein [Labilibaculum manganireducens]|uniref:Four helix bundle protein n=1 Tax=Labilibaculum manganireducens TaxID=1940525 RepID=A0A2N3HQR6_9BACT|nr:four helix bundle protein [Labilibaculum manganireducens]PKQ60404.1 four helix bundle protein [Labilibaculum manganireducens]
MKQNELQARLFNFSVDIIKQVRVFPNSREYQVISYQVLKSATSVGANYEEVQAAVSEADFANKISISLKELRETNYWIRIVNSISEEKNEWLILERESEELMKILGAIRVKMYRKLKR